MARARKSQKANTGRFNLRLCIVILTRHQMEYDRCSDRVPRSNQVFLCSSIEDISIKTALYLRAVCIISLRWILILLTSYVVSGSNLLNVFPVSPHPIQGDMTIR